MKLTSNLLQMTPFHLAKHEHAVFILVFEECTIFLIMVEQLLREIPRSADRTARYSVAICAVPR